VNRPEKPLSTTLPRRRDHSIYAAIFAAIGADDVDAVYNLLKANPFHAEAMNGSSSIALHMAARRAATADATTADIIRLLQSVYDGRSDENDRHGGRTPRSYLASQAQAPLSNAAFAEARASLGCLDDVYAAIVERRPAR